MLKRPNIVVLKTPEHLRRPRDGAARVLGRCCRFSLLGFGSLLVVVALVGSSAGAQNPTADFTASLKADFEQALADFDRGQNLQRQDADRARILFRSAAQRFESIAGAGVVNGRLYFNLGNAYLQAGDVGKAILYYRRAQRLIPGDVMLEDNLAVARSRCLTSIAPTRRSALLRSAFSWHYSTARSTRLGVGVLLYLVFWVLMMIRSFVRKTAVTGIVVVAGLLAAGCFCSVAVGDWAERRSPPGVVTGMDVVVVKGPGSGYQRQFVQPLQPGAEFTLVQQRGGWWQIELPDGQSGWVEGSEAELIAVPARD